MNHSLHIMIQIQLFVYQMENSPVEEHTNSFFNVSRSALTLLIFILLIDSQRPEK